MQPGLLRRVCHRAGHFGPDPLARNDASDLVLAARLSALVIGRSVSDEAIQSGISELDCFASLAMTSRSRSALSAPELWHVTHVNRHHRFHSVLRAKPQQANAGGSIGMHCLARMTNGQERKKARSPSLTCRNLKLANPGVIKTDQGRTKSRNVVTAGANLYAMPARTSLSGSLPSASAVFVATLTKPEAPRFV